MEALSEWGTVKLKSPYVAENNAGKSWKRREKGKRCFPLVYVMESQVSSRCQTKGLVVEERHSEHNCQANRTDHALVVRGVCRGKK